MFEYVSQIVQPKTELQALGSIFFYVGVVVALGIVAGVLFRQWRIDKKKKIKVC